MWSFPVAPPAVRGLLVCVSVVLVTKLFLGKNTLNPPSSFTRDRPSNGRERQKVQVTQNHPHKHNTIQSTCRCAWSHTQSTTQVNTKLTVSLYTFKASICSDQFSLCVNILPDLGIYDQTYNGVTIGYCSCNVSVWCLYDVMLKVGST